jgi:hypothetical protein
MSILTDGFSPSSFARKNAVLAGVVVGLVALVGNELYGKAIYYVSEPKSAPLCYGQPIAEGRKMIPGDLRDPDGQSIDRRGDDKLQRLHDAMSACTTQSCPREAANAYRSALFWYVSARTQHMSRLYRDYGNAGLQRARRNFGQSADERIVDGIRMRYAASVIRLNDFKQNKAAISILALRGSDALRPCGKGELGNDG